MNPQAHFLLQWYSLLAVLILLALGICCPRLWIWLMDEPKKKRKL